MASPSDINPRARTGRKTVILPPEDFRWAVKVGGERQVRAVLGSYDSHPKEDGWRRNIEGALSERGLSLAIEVPWHGSVELKPSGQEADVLDMEVRWVPHVDNPMLCIRKKDLVGPDGSASPKALRTFVLVTGLNAVKIIYGHMRAIDVVEHPLAKDWWTGGRSNWPKNEEPCWAVPYWHLEQLWEKDFPRWRAPAVYRKA
jgi:hypothetical protein